MASILLIFLLSFSFFFFSLSHSTQPHVSSALLTVKQACKATRFLDAYEASLSRVLPKASSAEVIAMAIVISSENLRTAQSMVKTIIDSSVGNPNHSICATRCLEALRYFWYRISVVNKALPHRRKKDAPVWMNVDCVEEIVIYLLAREKAME